MNTFLKTTFKFLVLLLLPAPLMAAQGWTGSWTYSAPYAPYGYETGTIVLTQKDQKSTALVEIGYSKLENIEVTQKEEKLLFSLFIEGTTVEVMLSPNGKDELIGTAQVDGSEIKVVAKRKPKL